ncbi:LacI family DNA-binding transcriptional regulator [Microbacterium sp. zg.Y909]|uniref:LacI family DNA-binding transcriptional regulator n=1 Tax=Microbacterium sp. zg.Y909 TaxID=2969413 RepID=UPI00214B2E08|nr:LacI family DNA-binding transcriptional regulator [Microbacterium sp. zg.Y909]MCR2825991.1 LacI family transcriptional regulator [Microbacterium sp. zg.Y909]
MRRTTSKATITDVARRAGVSLSTVSRVMNGNATVDAGLAERVRAAAVELGYTASPLARSLVLGRTQTIAVVVPDLANPTFQEILRGLGRAAAGDGYHVLIADSAEQVDEERVLAAETRRRTDGVVLCAPRMPDDELGALLPALSPAVVVNRPPQAGAPVVAADYRTAFADLIDHLYGLGHRRLVYLAGLARSASNAARLAALADARAAHTDLEITEVACGVDFDSGAAAAAAVRRSGATGVLAFNDLVAMGLLSALADRGVRVPEDLSVAGFDDIPFAQYTTPPLTTAAVPASDLGARAWQAMHALLTGGDAEAAVSLIPRLIVRASTGRVPA